MPDPESPYTCRRLFNEYTRYFNEYLSDLFPFLKKQARKNHVRNGETAQHTAIPPGTALPAPSPTDEIQPADNETESPATSLSAQQHPQQQEWAGQIESLKKQIRENAEQSRKDKNKIDELTCQLIELTEKQDELEKKRHSLQNTLASQTGESSKKIAELTRQNQESLKYIKTLEQQDCENKKNIENLNREITQPENNAVCYFPEYKQFRETTESYLRLLAKAEQDIRELCRYCYDQNLEKEYGYLTHLLGKYILSKPQQELSRWEGILYNMQYSGLIVDPVKNSLKNESSPELQTQLLKETIFYSLYQKYLNAILLLLEYTLQTKTENSIVRQKTEELKQLLNNIIKISSNDLNININYISLNQKLENDTHFNSVEIKGVKSRTEICSGKDMVIGILKYGINYESNTHEKTIVQCYV